MIDAINVTDFNASDEKLEELILFWVCAAGKNGVTAAKCLDRFLQAVGRFHADQSPFDAIRRAEAETYGTVKFWVQHSGIGCFNHKSKTFMELVNSGLDLRVCTVEDLESIKGIGPKTARCFLIHSRPNQRLAGLDVHILHYLRDQGHDVPKSTPTGNRYREIEQMFLSLVPGGKSVAEFDLMIWNQYRRSR